MLVDHLPSVSRAALWSTLVIESCTYLSALNIFSLLTDLIMNVACPSIAAFQFDGIKQVLHIYGYRVRINFTLVRSTFDARSPEAP